MDELNPNRRSKCSYCRNEGHHRDNCPYPQSFIALSNFLVHFYYVIFIMLFLLCHFYYVFLGCEFYYVISIM